ncbi:hypothetical protein BDW75DRAFT_242644 [Aspergillus navahoensis]
MVQSLFQAGRVDLPDLAFIAHRPAVQQLGLCLRQHPFPTAVQASYILMTDGVNFMLSFGDLVWIPLPQSRPGISPLTPGRHSKATNNQKHLFRTQPDHPAVRSPSSLRTNRRTRLFTPGSWSVSLAVWMRGKWASFPLRAGPSLVCDDLLAVTDYPARK